MKALRHGITSQRHAIGIFAPGRAWVPHWLRNLAETSGFHIQPKGIKDKTLVLLRSTYESTKKRWFYNGFRIQPIGINKQAMVLCKKHRNQHKTYGFYNGYAFNP